MITIEVSDQELVHAHFYLNMEQTILGLLKSKGAPILGELYFRLDKSYDVNFTSHPLGGSTYVFKKSAHLP